MTTEQAYAECILMGLRFERIDGCSGAKHESAIYYIEDGHCSCLADSYRNEQSFLAYTTAIDLQLLNRALAYFRTAIWREDE